MLACAGNDTSQVQAVTDPAPVAEGSAAQVEGRVNTAFHIAMGDGVRIAVDLWLPRAASGDTFPTILRATRYWRDQAVLDRQSEPETEGEAMAKSFVERGYAYLAIDARGTGASFGSSAQPLVSEGDRGLCRDRRLGRVAALVQRAHRRVWHLVR
jgi:predicted acyl esterase